MVVEAKAKVKFVADTKQFGKKVEGEIKGIGRSIKGMGVIVGAVIATHLVRSLGKCIEKAIAFDRNIRAIKQSLEHIGQAGAVNLGKLREEFERMAITYTAKGGAAEIAENYRLMVTGAYDAASATTELGNVAKANMVWHGRYGDALEYCNAMITAFDLETEKTTELLEMGAVACDRGRMSYDELAKAAGKYTPAIKGGVITTEEFIALVSTMTAEGASGRAALTGIGDALLDLPDTMDDVGMSFIGFTDALEQLRDKKMTRAEWKEFAPEVEERTSLQFIVSLYDDIIEAQTAMRESQGMLARETEEEMKTVEYSHERVKKQADETARAFGDKLVVALSEATMGWTALTKAMIHFGEEQRNIEIAGITPEERKIVKEDAQGRRNKIIAEIIKVEGMAVAEARAYYEQMMMEPGKLEKYEKELQRKRAAEERAPKKPKAGKEPEKEETALEKSFRQRREAEASREALADLAAFRPAGAEEQEEAIRSAGERLAEAKERQHQEDLGRIRELGEEFMAYGDPSRYIVEGFKSGDMKAAMQNFAVDLGTRVSEELLRALFMKGLMAILSMITGGATTALGMGPQMARGGVIKAAGGVSILPARPGGWTFPFAGKWITGAEGGQDEMLAVLPPGRVGRELLMRDVLPAYFPEISQTTNFRPTVNTEINLRGADPYHITAAVNVDQGKANRARIQRKASC